MKARQFIAQQHEVRAILDGRQTQFRRVIKPQPGDVLTTINDGEPCQYIKQISGGRWAYDVVPAGIPTCLDLSEMVVKNEYGQPGGLLWVRESHHIDWYPDGGLDAHGNPGAVHYRADLDTISQSWKGQWRSSIFMFRWASRITLRVKRVWVERVQDVSHDDCIDEGIAGRDLEDVYSVAGDFLHRCYTGGRYDYLRKCWLRSGFHFSEKDSFQTLWDSINAKRGFGWDKNPWAWCVEFERVTG